jgi:G:T-mismatch repair DNA endonuclease (very short patch repair protein)
MQYHLYLGALVKTLKKGGWNIIVFWDCKLKSPKAEKTLFSLRKKLPKGLNHCEIKRMLKRSYP